jgi:hypothetical protein
MGTELLSDERNGPERRYLFISRKFSNVTNPADVISCEMESMALNPPI